MSVPNPFKVTFGIFSVYLPLTNEAAKIWCAGHESAGSNPLKEQAHGNDDPDIFIKALNELKDNIEVIDNHIKSNITDSQIANRMHAIIMEMFSWLKRPTSDIQYVDGHWQYDFLMDI